ncbi:hypothetical protein SAMN02745824_2766 [Parasphingorhabdus marina DSM 22363]|uniref:Uncharacterized protein n=2 Tax=Parasphingorhabdus marina TaxID=394732 RepID=A0A1N6GC74_9SPHN|nr:hypothetical protein SAMN02745824_2766 [Parasphingorhabdus marina DSM 22363]
MFSLLLSLAVVGDTVDKTVETDNAEEKKIVCRTHRVLGSRIPERVCRTSKQWARIDKSNKEELQNRSNYSRGTQNLNED